MKKQTRLWLIAHGPDIGAYAIISLVLLAILYGLSVCGMLLMVSGNLALDALGLVLVSVAIGVAVAAVQWIVQKG